MKAMRTMITIISNNLDLGKGDKAYLNTCQIANNVYLTSKTPEETKSALYGVGYDGSEVLVSKLDTMCYEILKQNKRIVIK